MKHNRIYLATLAASLSLTIGSGDASAQRKISGQLEEVIVTAQKREQNLQDVPVSVSALDAAMIEKTFARDITDIAGSVPNLGIDPVLSNGTASISIRGMQLNDVEKSFDPAVAVYQDGIYLATTRAPCLICGMRSGLKCSEAPKAPCLVEIRSAGLFTLFAQSQPVSLVESLQ